MTVLDLETRFVETISSILIVSAWRFRLIKSSPVPIPHHSLSMDYIYVTSLGETQISLHDYMLHEASQHPKVLRMELNRLVHLPGRVGR